MKKRRLPLLWTRVGKNFKCFGCGEGGSAITFVMKMENLGFELALQNSRAQGLIVDRIEELLEPMRLLQGGGILKKILARLPSPDSPAAVQAFLASLPRRNGMPWVC